MDTGTLRGPTAPAWGLSLAPSLPPSHSWGHLSNPRRDLVPPLLRRLPGLPSTLRILRALRPPPPTAGAALPPPGLARLFPPPEAPHPRRLCFRLLLSLQRPSSKTLPGPQTGSASSSAPRSLGAGYPTPPHNRGSRPSELRSSPVKLAPPNFRAKAGTPSPAKLRARPAGGAAVTPSAPPAATAPPPGLRHRQAPETPRRRGGRRGSGTRPPGEGRRARAAGDPPAGRPQQPSSVPTQQTRPPTSVPQPQFPREKRRHSAHGACSTPPQAP